MFKAVCSLGVGLIVSIACAGGTGPPESPLEGTRKSVCEEIAARCHAHDESSKTAEECHLRGHSINSTEEQCRAKHAECLAACPASH